MHAPAAGPAASTCWNRTWNQFLLNFFAAVVNRLSHTCTSSWEACPFFATRPTCAWWMKKSNPKALTVHVSFSNSVWEIFQLATQQSPLCAPSFHFFSFEEACPHAQATQKDISLLLGYFSFSPPFVDIPSTSFFYAGTNCFGQH